MKVAVASNLLQVDLADVNFVLMQFMREFNDEQLFAVLGKSELKLDIEFFSFKVMDDWQKLFLLFSQHLEIICLRAHQILNSKVSQHLINQIIIIKFNDDLLTLFNHFPFDIIYFIQKKTHQQMKQLQKINQNLKHKHRNFRLRFNLDDQLASVYSTVKLQGSTEHQAIMENIIGDNLGHSRQKLKVVKKILESHEESSLPAKKLIVRYMLDLHLKEYIFGNTEQKPAMMNLLKQFDKLQPITIQSISKAYSNIAIEEFSQIRYCFELLEGFTKQQQITQVEMQKLEVLKINLIRELQSCVKIIFGDGFKLKWLEHFVDVLRAVNNLVKMYKQELGQDVRENILKMSRDVVSQYKILTKQVLTQIYLLMTTLNPNEPAPPETAGSCLIHYLHSRNIVLADNIIPGLLGILSSLKETEYKCQLVPILLKAFQSHFDKLQDKTNIFDQVLPLFQVGRSVYSYLQEIISMIIKDPQANWNLQGNFLRKFFVATITLKNNIPTQVIFKLWPTIISDCINQAGTMTIPYASDCASILFSRLFEQSGKDYKKWSSIWLGDYQKALLSQDRGRVRGVVEFINPILLSIDSEPSLLREIITLAHKQGSQAMQMGVIALLKCYKDLGKISIDNVNKSFIHADDPKIELKKNEIQNLLLSVDLTMSLKTLEFVTVHPKGSQPMQPLEFELALQFYVNCLKTSIPEFRKSYLAATKKMFERLRQVYDPQVTKTPEDLAKNKRYKPKAYFSQFKAFLSNLIDVCYKNVFPDVIFELANPSLEILLMIGNFFNRSKIEIKKGQVFEPAHILNSTNFFNTRNFDNLLCCLQSSYESVRVLSHQILQLFYDVSDTDKLHYLWSESLINANKLTIKSYEYACRILAFISQVYPSTLDLPKKYSLDELNICELFLQIVRERYEVFKVQFATQQENYYSNLIHGMLTVFSYTLDYLASRLRTHNERYEPYLEQLRLFLEEFFTVINQIVLFSVEVCSSNVSTVVLDSLPQSQTDKKYKVDCRGHFLEETSVSSSVSSLIQSTALLTSMQNQQQGIENTLVVSFYLLTREAGLVFQSISNITSTPSSQKYLPVEALVTLVNSYFYALINLKHMGSVDRIAGGLGKMARIIFENQDPRLSQLPQKLLDKLIQNLRDGKFTNILRRSAGVPYAFTCLLKSEALKRKQMIQKTLTALLDLSQDAKTQCIELRIHSLNILKKVFQDGDLKGDLDPYVSTAFVASIKGFTSEQWGVRNSSLMLFTVLANRTVGIKPTYNLLQFFHRCPQLLDFFTSQLQNQQLHTMYPPLYPIVLLFSRLLPFDLSQRVKLPNKGELNLKQIRKDRLLLLLPLIEKAGLNSNHMGRVMAAKAVLPFMDIDGIIPYSLNLLQSLSSIKQNNVVHYRLTAAYNLLLSLQQLKSQQKYHPKYPPQTVAQLLSTLESLTKLTRRGQSSVILQLLFKIIGHILEHYRIVLPKGTEYTSLTVELKRVTSLLLADYFKNPDLIIPMNMGSSMAIKECLHLYINLLYRYRQKEDLDEIARTYSQFLQLIRKRVQRDEEYLRKADTQIIEEYLGQIALFFEKYPNNHQLQNHIRQLIDKINMRLISSDNILIKIIELRTDLKIDLSPAVENFIKEVQATTQNHFLQIAIFKYFQALNTEHPFLLQLLDKYSRPEQLEELRECCVQYFEDQIPEKKEHYVTYIRLLEDEEYEIRGQMAKRVATILRLPSVNDEVLKKLILQRLYLEQFQQWLKTATDYETKRKNSQQQRIFSYDKPNKYRSDITNFIECLTGNPNLLSHPKEVATIISRVFEFHDLSPKNEQPCINEYLKDIINRNEYQFETVLRLYLLANQANSQAMLTILKGHPLLESVYQLYPVL